MFKQAFFKTTIFLLPLYLFSIVVLSQQKYWLEFNIDQKDSEKNQIELLKSSLKKEYQNEIEFHYQSKWNPVISISLKEEISSSLRNHPFIKSLHLQEELERLSIKTPTAIEYSYALEQLKAHYITDSMGLSGKNVKIGVIDGGFMGADVEPSLKDLVKNDQIIFFKDYLLKGNTDMFYGRRISGDDHGTQVLKMIAGADDGSYIKYGMAENATLFLARTDHGIRERRLEEDYWVEAIELFYDMGIRLVNSSLGYTNGFDKRKENHNKKEVDGKSSMITKTAQSAVEKGMLIVSAAGNDGHNKWGILSLPSDAKDVLTVGAVRFDDWSKMYYSSVGPEKLGYVKPDIVCFAANGTSFAAPVITGLAACIWEYDSSLSNLEVMNYIKSASHLAKTPNNYVGHGVPDSKKIMTLLNQEKLVSKLKSISSDQNSIEIEVPSGIETVVIYHKKDTINVVEQKTVKIEKDQSKMKLENDVKAKFTTIFAQDKLLLEIEWE